MRKNIPDNIHLIPLPTPFHVGPVNVYLIEGEPLTLLDCGVRTEESQQALEVGLSAHGFQLSDLEQVVISHHHTDHLGNVVNIIEASQADLIAHRYTAPYLETPVLPRIRDLNFFEEVSREGGVPENIIQLFSRSMKWIEQFSNSAIKVTRQVEEGDTIQMGGQIWHVYYTPGHAGDLICLFEPENHTLLASDHILRDISSNPIVEPHPEGDNQNRPQRLIEYMFHMRRMADLGIEIALGGHGDPVEDVRGLIEQRIQFHHQRAAQILTLFDGQTYNLWEATQQMFPHIRNEDKFLALSEVLGHIDILEDEDKLSREYQDGILYWHKIAKPVQAP